MPNLNGMISIINKAWNWKGFNATKIIRSNEFGNVIFKSDVNEYWRICPEEVYCERISKSDSEYDKISSDPKFIEDWEMIDLVEIARAELGELEENKKYCLKIPSIIGGEYNKTNFGIINFQELILFSGDLGFQIKDLKDGQKIKIEVKK